MNPKPIYTIGLLVCIVTSMIACHSTQSTTYSKSEVAAKPQTIQLPKVSQELQVEVVTEEKKSGEKPNNK
jgi:hypothetical protein